MNTGEHKEPNKMTKIKRRDGITSNMLLWLWRMALSTNPRLRVIVKPCPKSWAGFLKRGSKQRVHFKSTHWQAKQKHGINFLFFLQTSRVEKTAWCFCFCILQKRAVQDRQTASTLNPDKIFCNALYLEGSRQDTIFWDRNKPVWRCNTSPFSNEH